MNATIVKFLPILVVLTVQCAQGQDESLRDPRLDKILAAIELMQSSVREPVENRTKKYVTDLKELEVSIKSEGNLDLVLQVKNERESLEAGDPTSPIDHKDESFGIQLRKLRYYFDQDVAKLKDKQSKSITVQGGRISDALVKLEGSLTKEDSISKALAVRKLREEFAGNLDNGAFLQANENSTNKLEEMVFGPNGQYEREPDCNVDRKGDLFVLTSPKNSAKVRSKKEFRTPFLVQARMATDSNNIRIYFLRHGRATFNWEGGQNLSILDPKTVREHGIENVRRLTPGKMYDVEIQVGEEKIEVFVDERKVGEHSGDFTGLEGAIGIGPSLGSEVTVEYFKCVYETDE
jgi:hypothetical protein